MLIAKKRSFYKKAFNFPLDYITDGLTFCLDGEYNLGTKHGDCSLYVVDLINGIKLYPDTNLKILYTDKYFYASGTSGISTSYGDNNQNIVDNALGYGHLNVPKTIEICMKERSALNWALFYMIKWNTTDHGFFANEEVGSLIYRWGERITPYVGNDYLPVGLLGYSYMNKVFSLSVGRHSYNNVQAYVNCQHRDITTGKKDVLPLSPPLNAFIQSYFGTGYINIYSVRLYNRVLTEEEVIYNQTIDKNRFNIT